MEETNFPRSLSCILAHAPFSTFVHSHLERVERPCSSIAAVVVEPRARSRRSSTPKAAERAEESARLSCAGRRGKGVQLIDNDEVSPRVRATSRDHLPRGRRPRIQKSSDTNREGLGAFRAVMRIARQSWPCSWAFLWTTILLPFVCVNGQGWKSRKVSKNSNTHAH